MAINEKYTFEKILRWKSKDANDNNSNQRFLEQIADNEGSEIYEKVRDIHHEVFDKFNCLSCANCCKTTPPIFNEKDIIRIANFLKITPSQFEFEYTIEDVDGTLVGIEVPCTFLNEDNTCSIYEVRPQACRSYPHTDEKEFNQRSFLNFQNTKVCPAAYAIVQKLKERLTS